MRKYLEANLSDFKNKGKQLDRSSVKDVVFDHCCMVSSRHLDRMATGSWSPSEAPQGSSASPDTMPRVFPWHFEQHQDEAVFIPGGCMHQVGREALHPMLDFFVLLPEDVICLSLL